MPIDRDGDGPPLRRPESKVSLTPGEGRADLRATPFTDDVFNDDYYDRRSARSEGKSFSVVIGVVLGVAVAGGAGWYILRDGGGLTFTPSSIGFVKADPTPYKVRPDNPGGLQVENQDKLVYDRVAKGNTPNRVENLLPPAEEPKAPPPTIKPPVPVPAPAPAPAESVKPPPAPAEVAKAESPKAEPVKPAPAPVEVAKAEPPKSEPAKAEDAKPEAAEEEAEPTTPDALAAAVAAATAGRESATGPVNTVPAAEPSEAPVPPARTQIAAAVTAPAPSTATGGYQIQLASVLSEEAALAEWKRLSNKNKDILGTYTPAVTKADLGDRGVFYRLRAGPLADKAAADAVCASLASVDVGCIVVRP